MLVNITINGKQYQEESNLTILQAAKKNGIKIPSLCYFFHSEEGVEHKPASCRVCVVEAAVNGRPMRSLVPACATQIQEGMEIKTNSKRVIAARKTVVELLLSNHPKDCLTCEKSGRCELQDLANQLGIRKLSIDGAMSYENVAIESQALVRNPSKCVLCGRCVTVCKEVQSVNSLSAVERGFNTRVDYPFSVVAEASKCVSCGQCIKVCPTGALLIKDDTDKVERLIDNEENYVVINTAPGTRVALGEEFGLAPGTDVTGKMVAALRLLGFKKVFDTNFGADLTILEETTEFLDRFTKKENLPLITSCCPGWINFIETQYPELLNLPSSCKSPQQMTGAVIKECFAKENDIAADKIKVVSLMPCTAKKTEVKREQMKDTDVSITVVELADWIKRSGIDFANLQDEEFDAPLGASTGAADIFANTGGVIEAVARYASKTLCGKDAKIDFEPLRGETGIRVAHVPFGDVTLRICVVSGLANARKVLEEIKAGNAPYDAIEIMACPGGCVNGGGQPVHLYTDNIEIVKARQAGIRAIDFGKPLRESSLNPDVQRLYAKFLGNPGSHAAHELLHTTFVDKSDKK